jgi:hypothetical protein
VADEAELSQRDFTVTTNPALSYRLGFYLTASKAHRPSDPGCGLFEESQIPDSWLLILQICFGMLRQIAHAESR